MRISRNTCNMVNNKTRDLVYARACSETKGGKVQGQVIVIGKTYIFRTMCIVAGTQPLYAPPVESMTASLKESFLKVSRGRHSLTTHFTHILFTMACLWLVHCGRAALIWPSTPGCAPDKASVACFSSDTTISYSAECRERRC